MREQPGPLSKASSLNVQNSSVQSKAKLPRGLVGPSSTVSVLIEGIYAQALLDTGSQVTIVYQTFYQKHLKHLPLHSIENLEIWGLSDQKYP